MDPLSMFIASCLVVYFFTGQLPAVLAEAAYARRGEQSPAAKDRRQRLVDAGVDPATGGAMRQYLGNVWRDGWLDLDERRQARRAARPSFDPAAPTFADRLRDRVGDAVDRRVERWRGRPDADREPPVVFDRDATPGQPRPTVEVDPPVVDWGRVDEDPPVVHDTDEYPTPPRQAPPAERLWGVPPTGSGGAPWVPPADTPGYATAPEQGTVRSTITVDRPAPTRTPPPVVPLPVGSAALRREAAIIIGTDRDGHEAWVGRQRADEQRASLAVDNAAVDHYLATGEVPAGTPSYQDLIREMAENRQRNNPAPTPTVIEGEIVTTSLVRGGAVTGVVSGAAEARNIQRALDAANTAYVSELARIRNRISSLGEQTLSTVQMAQRSNVVSLLVQAAESAAAAQAAAKTCGHEVGPLMGKVAHAFERLNS